MAGNFAKGNNKFRGSVFDTVRLMPLSVECIQLEIKV